MGPEEVNEGGGELKEEKVQGREKERKRWVRTITGSEHREIPILLRVEASRAVSKRSRTSSRNLMSTC